MNALRQYWNGLGIRERWMLGGGGALALLILAYALVWEPWHRELDRLRQQVPAQRAALAWMQDQAALAETLRARTSRDKDSRDLPLLTVIEQTARDAGMRDAIRQMQPGEEGEVRIWLQDVYFDPWLLWVDTLRKKGIDLIRVSVSRSQQPNKVTIRMTLARADGEPGPAG